jgi:hypothetical protein
MTDTQKTIDQEPTAQPSAETLTTDNAPMIPKTRFDEVNTERNQLRERLAKLEADRQAEANRQMEEQGKFKELADQRQAEIERLKAYEEQVQAYIGQAEASNAAFIEQVPQERRGLIPSGYSALDLQSYLQNNRELLIGQEAKPFTPPSTNGGAGTYQRSNAQLKPLSSAELAIAAKMGISAEDYQLSKASMSKRED